MDECSGPPYFVLMENHSLTTLLSLFQLSVDWLDADAVRELVELQCGDCNVVVHIWHRQE